MVITENGYFPRHQKKRKVIRQLSAMPKSKQGKHRWDHAFFKYWVFAWYPLECSLFGINLGYFPEECLQTPTTLLTLCAFAILMTLNQFAS